MEGSLFLKVHSAACGEDGPVLLAEHNGRLLGVQVTDGNVPLGEDWLLPPKHVCAAANGTGRRRRFRGRAGWRVDERARALRSRQRICIRLVQVRATKPYIDSVSDAHAARVLAEARSSDRAPKKSRADRIARIRARGWPAAITEAVIAGRIAIGMTEAQVRASWGAPSRINRTMTGSVTHEQWVYGLGTYVYLTDGVVRTIQQ